jgi:PAS domain S-box-containing protein
MPLPPHTVARRSRKRIRLAPSDRLSLEQQIADLSARLVASSADQIDSEIQGALDRIRMQLGADRVCWYQNPDESSRFDLVYCSSAPNIAPSPASVNRDQAPWTMAQLLDGTPVFLNKQFSLPDTAVVDKSFFDNVNIRSLMLVPSSSWPHMKGLLALASVNSDREWSPDLRTQLGVLSLVIAAAVQGKRAQATIQESEQRFRRIFEDSSIGIALEDPSGHFVSVNPAFCNLTGYDSDELLHLSCIQLSYPDDLSLEAVLLEELWQGKRQNYQMEKRFFRKDGSLFWGHISVSLLTRPGGARPLVIGMLKDISDRKAWEEKLTLARLELQRLTARLIQAQDDERKRVSQELHDDIGQRLSLLTVNLDALRRQLNNLGLEAESQRAEELHQLASELATDIHNISHELHSSKLQHLGLGFALKDLCDRVSAQNQVVVNFSAEGMSRKLPPDVALCLFRVVQEALNNALKHSQARQVSVEAVQSRELIRVRIVDTGSGFDPTACSWGIGLSGMRERLRTVGGVLFLRSAPGSGTEITAEIKLAHAAAATGMSAA